MFLAHQKRISWDRNCYLTDVILPRPSREGFTLVALFERQIYSKMTGNVSDTSTYCSCLDSTSPHLGLIDHFFRLLLFLVNFLSNANRVLILFCAGMCCVIADRPRGYKTFYVLNSIEHEISTAHKN